MSTINSIPFRSTIFYRTDGTVAPLGTVFTIGTNNIMSTTNSLSLDTLTASTMTSFSTITASTIRTAGANVAIGQNVSNPNRFVDMRSDIANSMYFDFHSSDSAVPDYSTRIQSLGGATTGTGALNMTASTMGLMASSGVGIGTTVPQAPLHVYNALGVSLSNTNVVNYTQSAILGFNFGGGVATGTRDSFRILSQTVNRDNGAGPTFFDYGAQADLIFQRKTNNLYSGGINDMTYTEVMRIGGATGFVGISTTNPATTLHVYQPLSLNSFYSTYGTATTMPAQLILESPSTHRLYLGSYYTGGQGELAVIQSSAYFSSTDHAGTLLLNPNGGVVGIGLTGPSYTLDVNSGSSILCIGARCSSSDTALDLINTSAAGYTWRIGSAGTGSGGGAGNLYIYGSSAGNLGVKMVIAPNGKVGIGKISPSAALDVTGALYVNNGAAASSAGEFQGLQLTYVGTGSTGYANITATNPGATYNAICFNPTAGGSGGYVGIGITNPIVPFHVNVFQWTNVTAGSWTASIYNQALFGPASSNQNISAYFVNYASSGNGFITYSDKRIKKDIKPATNCLDAVLQLQPVTYRKKNVIEDGNELHTGFIAQDVQEIYPSAIHKQTDTIPSIYEIRHASLVENGIQLTQSINVPLEARVVVIDFRNKKIQMIHHSDNILLFEDQNDTIELDGDKVFIFGHEVSDKLLLNHDTLFAVGMGAIKELAQKHEALAASYATLQARMDALEARLAS